MSFLRYATAFLSVLINGFRSAKVSLQAENVGRSRDDLQIEERLVRLLNVIVMICEILL